MKKLKEISKSIQKNKRYVILFVVFAIIYIAIYIVFRKNAIKQEDISAMVTPYGVWGPLILLGTQIIFSLTPMPDAAMPMLAYVLYGYLGVLLIMLGMTIAAIIHYYIGKALGKEVLIKRFPSITNFLNKLNNGNTVMKLIYMRIFTFVSFDVTSYIAGISNIPFKTFFIATLIALIPTNFTLVVISSGLFAKTTQDSILVMVLVIICLSVLAYLYKRSRIK